MFSNSDACVKFSLLEDLNRGVSALYALARPISAPQISAPGGAEEFGDFSAGGA